MQQKTVVPLQVELQKACQIINTLIFNNIHNYKIVYSGAFTHTGCALSHTRTKTEKKYLVFAEKNKTERIVINLFSYNFMSKLLEADLIYIVKFFIGQK